MAKGGDEAIDELYSAIQDGFKSGKLSYKDGRFETDDDRLREDIESFSDNIQKFAKQIGEASGKGREIQDELEKLMLPDIEDMSKKAEERKEISKKNDAGKKSVSEETKETAKKAGENAGKAVKAGIAKSEFNKGLNDTITNEGADATADYIINNAPEFKALVRAYRQAVNNGQLKVYRDGGVTGKDNKELRKTLDPLFDDFDNLLKEAAKNPDFDRKGVEKLLDNELENIIAEATETKYGVRDNTKKLEHSSNNSKALITNSAMGDELMDEYSLFQKKVKAGKERNRLAHSTTISPAELNSRYEKELESHGILVHAGNYKYYNKIDLPNGTTRYFYTKAEWDAYREGKNRTAYEDAKKAKTTSGGAKAEADIEADKRTSYENSQKAKDAKKKIDTISNYNKAQDTEKELWKSSAYAKDFGDNKLFSKVHDAYNLALAEAGGIDVKKLNGENPFYGAAGMVHRNQLLDKTNTDPEFEIKVVDLWKDKLSEDDLKELKSYMNKGHNKDASEHESDRFDEKTVKQDVDYINKLTDVIKDHYHNGYKDGGNFYSSGIKSDGPALAKHLKDLYDNAVKTTTNEFEANKEFLNSLSKDDIHLILSAQNFYNSQINESSQDSTHDVYTMPQNIDELLKILNQYKKPINKLTNEVVEKAHK